MHWFNIRRRNWVGAGERASLLTLARERRQYKQEKNYIIKKNKSVSNERGAKLDRKFKILQKRKLTENKGRKSPYF